MIITTIKHHIIDYALKYTLDNVITNFLTPEDFIALIKKHYTNYDVYIENFDISLNLTVLTNSKFIVIRNNDIIMKIDYDYLIGFYSSTNYQSLIKVINEHLAMAYANIKLFNNYKDEDEDDSPPF